MTEKDNIFLAKRNLVDSIWKSVQLEGLAMTYPETQVIVEGMRLKGHTDEEISFVNDLKHAWNKMLDEIDEPLTVDYIKSLHMVVGKFTVINAGCFRGPYDYAGIGGTAWVPQIPDEAKIITDIAKLLKTSDETDRAINIMLYLLRGQFFHDGNKRISNLIANKILIQNGCGVFSVPSEDRVEYLTLLLRFYESNDSRDIRSFIYKKCIVGNNPTVRS
ncbi:MAG: Fic family protein [Ruminococcus sp.]|nr:Fic family protein [Ruminococcus sp.]